MAMAPACGSQPVAILLCLPVARRVHVPYYAWVQCWHDVLQHHLAQSGTVHIMAEAAQSQLQLAGGRSAWLSWLRVTRAAAGALQRRAQPGLSLPRGPRVRGQVVRLWSTSLASLVGLPDLDLATLEL